MKEEFSKRKSSLYHSVINVICTALILGMLDKDIYITCIVPACSVPSSRIEVGSVHFAGVCFGCVQPHTHTALCDGRRVTDNGPVPSSDSLRVSSLQRSSCRASAIDDDDERRPMASCRPLRPLPTPVTSELSL